MLNKFNLGSLMKGAKKIQEMIEKNQEELAKIEVVGESGAGLVKVIMNGLYAVKNVILADELLTETKEIMQELITAAINNATQKVSKVTQSKMTDMSQLFSTFNDEKE